MSFLDSLKPRQLSDAEVVQRAAWKAAAQRKSDLKNPSEGFGISVKEAARRLHKSVSTVYRMIASGKIQVWRCPSKAGGRSQMWVAPLDIVGMEPFQPRSDYELR